MRVIIHAGLQKTGSSALQEYLAAVRPQLAEAGYVYPDFGHRGHFMVTAALHPRPDRYGHAARRHRNGDVSQEVAQVRAELDRLIADSERGATLILSHEDLGTSFVATPFAQMLDKAGVRPEDTAVIAYVRQPGAHYPTAVQQALKAGKLRDFVPGIWTSQHLARAGSLVDAFGDGVHLRLYRPPSEPDWNVIEDFAQAVEDLTGRPLPPATAVHSRNSSLSAEACAVLWRATIDAPADIGGEILRRNVRLFDETAGGRALVVPESWKAAIAEPNARPWNALLKRIGLSRADWKAARLSVRPAEMAISEADFAEWLSGALDPDYLTRLAAFCRGPDAKHKRVASRVADWVETLR